LKAVSSRLLRKHFARPGLNAPRSKQLPSRAVIFRRHQDSVHSPGKYNKDVMKVASIGRSRMKRSSTRLIFAATALFLSFGLAACQRARGVDTQPLNNSGMSYDSVKQLEDLKVTSVEVASVLKMRDAGLPDADCVQIVRIARSRGQVFDDGNAVAGLIRAGMSDETILALANLNQIGPMSGEFGAMHLAGLSDAIVLEVARHRADGKPVLSGASLAGLKNTGLRGSTLLDLARRDIPDSEAKSIISFRRRGASDSQILRRFSGS
jgi:hypothetical protein